MVEQYEEFDDALFRDNLSKSDSKVGSRHKKANSTIHVIYLLITIFSNPIDRCNRSNKHTMTKRE